MMIYAEKNRIGRVGLYRNGDGLFPNTLHRSVHGLARIIILSITNF